MRKLWGKVSMTAIDRDNDWNLLPLFSESRRAYTTTEEDGVAEGFRVVVLKRIPSLFWLMASVDNLMKSVDPLPKTGHSTFSKNL